jgi:methionine aminotransferase
VLNNFLTFVLSIDIIKMVSLKSTSKKNIFSAITDLANEMNALNLATPMSDFACPERLIELVAKNMRLGNNGNSPDEGVISLREQIISLVNLQYKTNFSPDSEITITAGPAQAMTTAISTFIKDGDEVIIFEPVQESYAPFIELNGGRPIFVSLKYPDFKIDWDEVKKLVTSKTRMIIINNPQNPMGQLLGSEDLNQIKRMINGTRIIILSNEVFNHLIFDDQNFYSLNSIPELAAKSLVVSSFGPDFNIHGWGIAHIIGPEKLMSEFRKIQQIQGFSVNTPAQYALAEFLKDGQDFKEICAFHQSKRDYFIDLLVNSQFNIIPSSSTYYQLVDYSRISDLTDVDFAIKLITEHGVATVPFSAFQHEKTKNQLLRVCFAKSNKVLEQAAHQLNKIPAYINQS